MYFFVILLISYFLFVRVKITLKGKPIKLQCLKKKIYFFRFFQTIFTILKPTFGKKLKLLRKQQFENVSSTIDWVFQYQNRKHTIKTLIILPGLTGNFTHNYIIQIVDALKDYPYDIGIYNHPLVSNKPVEGQVNIMTNFQLTLQNLKNQQPKRQIQCVGVSYGANQLMFYLGKKGNKSLVSKAVVVGNPFNLNICSQELGWFWDKMLNYVLIKKMNELKNNFKAYDLDYQKINKSKNVKEFDENFTIKVYNFPSVTQYYSGVSSSNHVHNVKIPTLSISCQNDQICSIKAVPFECDTISYLITSTGGHVGCIDWKLRFWFVEPIEEYLTTF